MLLIKEFLNRTKKTEFGASFVYYQNSSAAGALSMEWSQLRLCTLSAGWCCCIILRLRQLAECGADMADIFNSMFVFF